MNHRIIDGFCEDCIAVQDYSVEYSICWQCGHIIDLLLGHICTAVDDR